MYNEKKVAEREWENENTPIFRVIDTDGSNPGEAMVRQSCCGDWLYVDGVDGYRFATKGEVAGLTLVIVEV
jgi:hypothetical protein